MPTHAQTTPAYPAPRHGMPPCAAFLRPPPARPRQSGFTLIEVMIVVVVIGLLAAVAIPSYQSFVRKGHRADARAAIYTMMQQQERWYTQNNTYVAVANSSASSQFKNWTGDSFATAKWRLAAAACAGQQINACVQITASPVAPYTDPEVGNLSLTSAGARSCTGTDTSACWPN